jgi:hypothetical protein
MLDQLLNRLPKTMLALLVIVVGFVVIVVSDPPRTVCDSQLELFQQQQSEFLYGGKDSSGKNRPALVKKLYTTCQETNSPGGCFEYFLRLKKLNQDLDLIPKHCSETVAKDSTLKSWLLGSLKIMTEISWGDRGPASFTRKNAWFDASDLSMFCGLKKQALRIYGVETMDQWREGVLANLPEAAKLDHESLYQKSLVSTPCEAYR